MKNEIAVFQNSEFGEIRTLAIEGEPWFVGKDVAERLGYSNTADAIQKHVDSEDKLTSQIAIAGQNRNVVLIKDVNDFIIVKHKKGWQYSNLFRKIPLNNFDVMPNPPIGLKTMEGFMGNNIKETDVPFNIQRKLTQAEIDETIKYCRHDVENTIEVFLERKSEFDAMLQMVKIFKMPLSYIGKTDAGITAKVLDCVYHDWNDEFDFIIEPFIKLEKYGSVLEWFRNAKTDWIVLQRAKDLVEKYFTHEGRSFTSDLGGKSTCIISYDTAYPIPKEDAQLKSIQINLTILEWKVR